MGPFIANKQPPETESEGRNRGVNVLRVRRQVHDGHWLEHQTNIRCRPCEWETTAQTTTEAIEQWRNHTNGPRLRNGQPVTHRGVVVNSHINCSCGWAGEATVGEGAISAYIEWAEHRLDWAAP